MKVLVLCESLNENDSSGTKGRVGLLKSFVKAGFSVTALHYSQKDLEIEGVECILVKENKASLLFVLSRIQRLLFRWFKINISPTVDKLFGFPFGFFNDAKSLSKAVKKFKPYDFQMIWTLSKGDSYRSHKAVLALPQWHKKWYAYVHDPYPQQLYPRPYNFVPHGYRKKRYFFRAITQKAKRVVFPSLLLKEWMQSYFVDVNGKSLIIPHQLRSIPFSKQDLPNYFDTDKFNLLHAGSLLDLRDPKPIIEAYQEFLNKVPKAKDDSSLLFIGKASVFTGYLLKQQSRIPQIYLSKDYVPFKNVYAMQQLASINIILEAKSEISPFLPGKFPHCVAANTPMFLIGPYYSECKRILGETYPYQFDFDDVDKLANAMVETYKIWQDDKEMLKLNRKDLIQYLSANHLKKVILETSENLVV